MKKILLIAIVFIATKTTGQTNKDYLVSMDGIGPFKYGMQVPELEKLLHQKIQLKNVLIPDIYYDDTIKVKYKNANFTLYISKQQTVDPEKYEYVIHGVKTNSPLCKTSGGIGLGADKIRVVSGFENNYIQIDPEYLDDTYTIRSKTTSTIYVQDNFTGAVIIFRLKNKKVVEVEMTVHYSDSE